jgi:transcriptional regulator with XRE-family HTH domain
MKKNSKLRERIFKQGMTQKAFAERVGLPASLISMIIHGRYAPSQAQEERLAAALGKERERLF